MISAYIESHDYEVDLDATRQLWQRAQAIGISGAFIFSSYFTIPPLIAVFPIGGRPRITTMRFGLDSEREKRFLQRLLGLDQDEDWSGGLRNQKVQTSIIELRSRHLTYQGMTQDYMTFFTGIIALSILRTCEAYGWEIPNDRLVRYWRYMTYASAFLGVALKDVPATSTLCNEFTAEYSAYSDDGKKLAAIFHSVYPDYLRLCLPVLFPATQKVIPQLLEDENA
ncbi:MAG: hypothetical protein IAE95_00290 [Chitinophagaceae bacterium]|nr:hypothetical protein [Chitinophagaceae bacterium]